MSDPAPNLTALFEEYERLRTAYDLLERIYVYAARPPAGVPRETWDEVLDLFLHDDSE